MEINLFFSSNYSDTCEGWLLIPQAADLYYSLEETGDNPRITPDRDGWGCVAPQMAVGISASLSSVVCFHLQLGNSMEGRPCVMEVSCKLSSCTAQELWFSLTSLHSLPLHLDFQSKLVFWVAVVLGTIDETFK